MATRKIVSPPSNEAAVDSQAPRAPLRSLNLLSKLALAVDGLTLSQLALAVETPKTSVLALLRALLQGGYVQLDGTRYRLGDAAHALATLIASQKRPADIAHLPEIAQPFLHTLAQQSGETVFVSALAPDSLEAIYVARAESAHPIRFMASIGERRPLYSSAGGRTLLAFLPKETQEDYLAQIKPVAFTSRTLTDKRRLRKMLEEIRATGVATTADDTHFGVSAFGMPLRGPDGEVAAALVLAAPSDRVEPQSARLVTLLREHAQAISRALGYIPAG
ncbi:IclR family transcriptional regulator [Variovorax sp. KK3]|uniref:IclR family transcriptional regulator n=1 Tax=Variovorax sp. KK3 TaxID=1855728 RepID=UPI00097BFD26|nr:IclR family transcriptional regulator [Variovorax sp. KK3]